MTRSIPRGNCLADIPVHSTVILLDLRPQYWIWNIEYWILTIEYWIFDIKHLFQDICCQIMILLAHAALHHGWVFRREGCKGFQELMQRSFGLVDHIMFAHVTSGASFIRRYLQFPHLGPDFLNSILPGLSKMAIIYISTSHFLNLWQSATCIGPSAKDFSSMWKYIFHISDSKLRCCPVVVLHQRKECLGKEIITNRRFKHIWWRISL